MPSGKAGHPTPLPTQLIRYALHRTLKILDEPTELEAFFTGLPEFLQCTNMDVAAHLAAREHLVEHPGILFRSYLDCQLSMPKMLIIRLIETFCKAFHSVLADLHRSHSLAVVRYKVSLPADGIPVDEMTIIHNFLQVLPGLSRVLKCNSSTAMVAICARMRFMGDLQKSFSVTPHLFDSTGCFAAELSDLGV